MTKPATFLQPYNRVQAYRTKDGSEIRELMHPLVHGNRSQSLAEATVPAGGRTLLHRHGLTEEIYHVTAGRGVMVLGTARFALHVGDTVCIPPGMAHRLEAGTECDLKVLCCCTPAYRHEDTVLLEEASGAIMSAISSSAGGAGRP